MMIFVYPTKHVKFTPSAVEDCKETYGFSNAVVINIRYDQKLERAVVVSACIHKQLYYCGGLINTVGAATFFSQHLQAELSSSQLGEGVRLCRRGHSLISPVFLEKEAWYLPLILSSLITK